MGPKAYRAAMLLLLTLAGCASGATPSPSPTPVPTPGEEVTFHVRNVHLETNGEEGSDEIRIGLVKAGNARIEVTSAGAVDICPVPDLSQKASTSETCTPGASANFPEDAVAVRPKAASLVLDDIAITFRPTRRVVRILMPLLAPMSGPCSDGGCAPSVEATPARAGRLTATATWSGIAKGQLSLVEAGRTVSKQDASSDQGRPRVLASTTVRNAPIRILLANISARPLRTAELTITFP